MGVVQPIREYVATLVHPSAQSDALTASRHRAFIAPRLIGSVIALAALPAYIVMRGLPSVAEALVFGWLVAPILTAFYLSRTGRFESAHMLSALALTGLVTAVASQTGGIASFAAIWLVVVPLEAALSASRRVVALACTAALLAAGLLLALEGMDALPAPDPAQGAGALAALGIISASLYATALALGAESLARTTFWLFHAEEDRYRLLARNMTDGITRHGRNGTVLFASPATERLFGAPVSALIGHRLFDRVHVGDRPAYLTAIADAAEGAERSVEFRARRDSAGGNGTPSFVWVEMRCRPLDQTARVADEREVVAVMRDVTDRKNHEDELRDIRAEADRANAAKGRFLATMSHELRTPLNAIIGFSEMLTQEEKMRLDAARRQDYARLINESGIHLLAVVNDILDMSKMEMGDFTIHPEPCSAQAAIRSCSDMLALKAREAGVDLVLRLDADMPEIVADTRALKQIMLNLMSNAVKFTDRGGCVRVSAAVDAETLTIAVEDNGVGIAAADLPRLGSPFFQARAAYDRRHEGTGLGLSIVKGLVTLHGGVVMIDSTPGVGTRVTVRLPTDCETARPAAVVAHPALERDVSTPPASQRQVKKRA